ncbi:hypothetical protein PR048_029900 [Dryococelus australis]|uniref:Tesmin/TSO1-like CXC domain-containing protein n=1 Tax=Dryococelus australis TaxID=614101 RepID=A0ABQ9G7G0_9NEOP|nr:hypothetical protein PR048_029900 [Dryococelus australis]
MTVNRLLHPSSVDIIAVRGKHRVNRYKKSALLGLKGINIRELATVSDATARSVKSAIAADVLWSSVPFILDPSNRSTIYTALLFAVEECKCHNQGSCIVTLDQPLYAKALEIIAAAPPGELDIVTLRVGGFHLLVRFMGSIGFIMSGSGIEELWMQGYDKSSVTHMISNHAFSTAVRAYMLTSQALITMILGMENLFGVYQEELHKLFLGVSTGEKMIPVAVELPVLVSFLALFERKFTALSEQSCTGKLWVQYLLQVDTLRLFIRAERSGDRELHLKCVRSMLPYLHAAGHIHYTKSAHLYVQQMEELPSRMSTHEYNKLTSEGFFTVQRKNEFWGGSRILYVLSKLKGDLQEGVESQKVHLCIFCSCFSCMPEVVQYLGGAFWHQSGSSEQHVELRDSHRTRDARDVAVLLSWLKEHSPWDVDCLRSLASGAVGDDSISCDQAEYVGLGATKHIIGSTFGEVKLTQNNRVKPLSAVARSILIRDDNVVEINSHRLFMWIVYVMKTENDLKHYFSYKLSPRPPALSDEVAMHKTENSSNDPGRIVNDGGHLLHALVWPYTATYGQIADAYLEFVQKHYIVSVTVVFDGYNVQSTKSQEHFRRASKNTSAEIMFHMNTSASTTQADFLSNYHNKERLITLFSRHFETAGIEVRSSEGDADTLIVKRALGLASVGNNVTVVAFDTDIAVMLLARTTDYMELRVLSPGTNTKCDKVYNVREIQEKIGESEDSVLFCHAVTGCDTTSAFLGKGKKTAWKILKRPDMRNVTKLFNSPESTKEEVCAAGEKFVTALYSRVNVNSLDELRVNQYTCSIAKQSVTAAFSLVTLPPTSAACAEHSLRTYYQVRCFKSTPRWCDNISLNPVNWGWKLAGGFLVPVLTSQAPAPESLLRLVSCGCKTGCGYRCECRCAGLTCSTMCGHCRGGSCMNIKIQDFHGSDDEDDPEEATL